KLSSQIRNQEDSESKHYSRSEKIPKTRTRSSSKDNYSFTTIKSWPVAKKRKNLASSTNNHNRTLVKSKQDKHQVSDIVLDNQIDDRMNIDRRFSSVRKNQNLEQEKIPRSKHKNDVQFLFQNFRFDDDDNEDQSISQKSKEEESDIVVHSGSILADETFVG
uniref:Uncharacterized protein n=1 Tax=Romanomermis culicivorax TaxID=13658 RepID=A0A915KYF4_ROMCU